MITQSHPKGEATKTKPLLSTIFQINLPRDLPTGQYPRESPIDWSSNLPIELPIAWSIPWPIEFLEDKPNLSPTRSPNWNPSRSLNLPIKIMRELQIYQSIPWSPDRSPGLERDKEIPSYRAPDTLNKCRSHKTRKITPSRSTLRSPDQATVWSLISQAIYQ